MKPDSKSPDAPAATGKRHLYATTADLQLIESLRVRLKAASNPEAIRRAVVTVNSMLDVIENGGEIVLCKPGQPEKSVWFV